MAGREQENGAIQVSLLLKLLLRDMDGVDPSRFLRVGVDLFPVRVEIPFTPETFEKAGAILREGAPVLRREVGEITADKRDGRKQDVLHAPTEIPVEEGAVQDQAIDGIIPLMLMEVIGRDESAGRVPHQPDPFVPFHTDRGERRVDIGEIFVEVFAKEGILVWAERAAVFPEVERVEVVTPCVDTIAKLSLEEIVVIAVHVEDGVVRSGLRHPFDKGADNLALIIIGHAESPLEILVAQNIGLVLCPYRQDGGKAENRDVEKPFHFSLFLR